MIEVISNEHVARTDEVHGGCIVTIHGITDELNSGKMFFQQLCSQCDVGTISVSETVDQTDFFYQINLFLNKSDVL